MRLFDWERNRKDTVRLNQRRYIRAGILSIILVIGVLLMVPVKTQAKTKKKPKLSKKNIEMTVGDKTTLSLKNYQKLSPKQVKKVKWTSSNKKVVQVKYSGKYRQKAVLTAKKAGSVVVKLKYKKKTYKCKVVVKEAEPPLELPGPGEWRLTQYASCTGMQSMCYTIEDHYGNLMIIDGGWSTDATVLREIIAKHNNRVAVWIITHAHLDHVNAFNVIASDLQGIVIDQIYTVDVHRQRYQETARNYDDYATYEYFYQLTHGQLNVRYLYENDELDVLGLHMKVLHTWDEDTDALDANLINNGSMLFTLNGIEDKILFCADVENETEQFILDRHMEDLANVNYLQAGHHGNWGMTTEFYQHLNPKMVFFDCPDSLFVTGTNYDAYQLRDYFTGRGIPVYNFSTAPNVVILR